MEALKTIQDKKLQRLSNYYNSMLQRLKSYYESWKAQNSGRNMTLEDEIAYLEMQKKKLLEN